jgi:hypothetical protein
MVYGYARSSSRGRALKAHLFHDADQMKGGRPLCGVAHAGPFVRCDQERPVCGRCQRVEAGLRKWLERARVR